MKKAWIENGKIRDIAQGDPDKAYNQDVARLYTESVPDDAENGDSWDGITLTKPPTRPPAPEPAFVYPKTTAIDFLLRLSPIERVAIRAARKSDPRIDDYMLILEDKRLIEIDPNRQEWKDMIEYFIAAGRVAADRIEKILGGE